MVVVVVGRFAFSLGNAVVVIVLMPLDWSSFVVAFDVASGVNASISVEDNVFGFAFGFFFFLQNDIGDLIGSEPQSLIFGLCGSQLIFRRTAFECWIVFGHEIALGRCVLDDEFDVTQ